MRKYTLRVKLLLTWTIIVEDARLWLYILEVVDITIITFSVPGPPAGATCCTTVSPLSPFCWLGRGCNSRSQVIIPKYRSYLNRSVIKPISTGHADLCKTFFHLDLPRVIYVTQIMCSRTVRFCLSVSEFNILNHTSNMEDTDQAARRLSRVVLWCFEDQIYFLRIILGNDIFSTLKKSWYISSLQGNSFEFPFAF